MSRIAGMISYYTFSKVNKSLKILSLIPPVTKKQIKLKYFELAKQHHPDINK